MKRFLWTMLCAIALNARADDAAILDKDFQTMMAWLPGVYDNQEQVYFEEEQGVDEALRHQRVHSVFEPEPRGGREMAGRWPGGGREIASREAASRSAG